MMTIMMIITIIILKLLKKPPYDSYYWYCFNMVTSVIHVTIVIIITINTVMIKLTIISAMNGGSKVIITIPISSFTIINIITSTIIIY